LFLKKKSSGGVYSVTRDWQGCFHHMGTTETANYKKYGMISDVTERIIIPLWLACPLNYPRSTYTGFINISNW